MSSLKEEFSFNTNLISLKCVLFCFFGAIGSLIPFLSLHGSTLELSRDETVTISYVVPIIACLGPLIFASLADRLAGGFGGGSRSKTGGYLRYMISICIVLASLFYWLLLTIVPSEKFDPLPKTTFVCNEEGGYVFQNRVCGQDKTCYDWDESTAGSMLVKNCKFDCNVTSMWTNHEAISATEGTTHVFKEEDYRYEESGDYSPPSEPELVSAESSTTAPNVGFMPFPHLCYNSSAYNYTYICDVYTEDSRLTQLNLSLRNNIEKDLENPKKFCTYPIVERFKCVIPKRIEENLIYKYGNCSNPVIACELEWPYNNTNSLLKESQCGFWNNPYSFPLYIALRSLADLFLASAVVLIATAVVIATRETSTGRGDVGKQLAAGALGLAIFPPIIGACQVYIAAIICYSILMFIAVFIILFDRKLPLSPPEWWWHTRCGLLALPMSSVRKFGVEIGALALVLLLLGIFWNAIDAFLPWRIEKLQTGSSLLVGWTYTVAALPAFFFLLFAERIVDYCGHSNLLMLCFALYIIHNIAILLVEEAVNFLACEFLEILTLHLMWITAILYFRHLVPRKLTATAQAVPIIAHFCLGRAIGAGLGSLAYTDYKSEDHEKYVFQSVYKWFSVSASTVGIIYFALYHLYLKTNCGAPPQLPPYPAPSVVQSVNGHGAYAPLRVYHNSSAKKGHFRY